MINKTHLTFFEIVKIWWSLFWRSNVYILIVSIYVLLTIAIAAIILYNINLNGPISDYLRQTISSTIEAIQSLDKESFKPLYFKLAILGSVLALPLYLKAFKNLHDITYKGFILKLPPKNNFRQRFQILTPYYASVSTYTIFIDYGLSLMPEGYGNEVISMVLYGIGTYYLTRVWLIKAVAKGKIILEPRP